MKNRGLYKVLSKFKKLFGLTGPSTKEAGIVCDRVLKPAQWPKGRELFRHLEFGPYVILPINFDHKACLHEALALVEKFVVHRYQDQIATADGGGRWMSLSINALDGDSSKTLDHYHYGIHQPTYRLSEIARFCPKTLEFLERLTDLRQCKRVRFMLLEPGARIKIHSDSPDNAVSLAVNVSLNMPAGCEFWTDMNSDGSKNIFSKPIPIQDGSVFLFNNAPYHEIRNQSDKCRIHIIIHGPIRFDALELLNLSRQQNRVFSEKAVINSLMFKRLYFSERKKVLSDDIVDWLDQGIDGNFLPKCIRPVVVKDLRVTEDVLNEAVFSITHASLFPLVAETIEVSTVTEWLKQQSLDGGKFAVLIGAGTYVKDVTQFFMDLPRAVRMLEESRAGLMGHIICRPTSYQDGRQLPYLHEQFAIVNLERWVKSGEVPFDIPYENIEAEFPEFQTSSENVHDDYTPLWIGPLPEENVRSVRFGRAGWATRAIAASLKNGIEVINVPLKLRATKKFSYPLLGRGEQYFEIKKDIEEFLKIHSDRVYVFNNEPTSIVNIPNLRPNSLISVAAGFKPFSIMKRYFGTGGPEKILFVDSSLRALEYLQRVVSSKSQSELVETLSQEFGFQYKMEFGAHEKVRAIFNELLEREFSNDFRELFQYLEMAERGDFLHANFILQPQHILSHIEPQDRILMWHSNVWKTNAAMFQGSPDDLLSNYIDFGKSVATKTKSELWQRKDRFELILGSSLEEPKILMTDGVSNSFSPDAYCKLQ